jgi:Amidase
MAASEQSRREFLAGVAATASAERASRSPDLGRFTRVLASPGLHYRGASALVEAMAQKEISSTELTEYTIDQLVWPGVATLPSLPATVAPIDRSASGLPIGVQIIGNYLEDRTTIAFAGLIESAFGGFVPPREFAN